MLLGARMARTRRGHSAPRLRRALIALAASGAAALALALAGPAQAKTAWLCKPGQSPNPCFETLQTTVITSDGAATIVNTKRAKRPKVDCFYVYPTVSDQTTTNADLTVDPQQTAIARFQASRFSQRCRVFAPMYRQLTLDGINEPSVPSDAVLLAYSKLELQRALVASDVPDDSYLHDALVTYFPPDLRTGYEPAIASHPRCKPCTRRSSRVIDLPCA